MKLASINIEKDRHIGQVTEFLSSVKPDIVCMQEVLESRLPHFKESLGMDGVFVPMAEFQMDPANASRQIGGICILSKHALENVRVDYYHGTQGNLPKFVRGDETTLSRLLLSATIGGGYVIGTTHFTWCDNGETNDMQRHDIGSLLEILEGFPQIVFCGDFNAPRGREIFSRIAKRYTDHIPAKYMTSIDGKFHRAGQLPYMVDGLFGTSGYTAKDVKLVDGLSDHMAIVADIEKM